ncbi:dimethyl sulfoxide reductase anchor subunit family protein [Thalassovita taeanensis]|uniref:DMSO reductase anchor subunit n=1 Tax=Thalassovita taeanensis TaxID=657014 RepID=A0A1H9FD66_9RHOB|nr:DmsC/YnfH family molybdoenzyme membrane anchor subunit [Thalassovita taeanensis]SEQ35859.1 DMSO reductase anchor subunit [Thalassovita taeanensis]
MHPAPSLIAFTTLSGLGFGLLAWLGLGLPSVTGVTAFVFFTIAYVLAAGGLLASALHLGHPERAWRAFSQWRSSWLSREGCASVAALLVMAAYGAALVFWGQRIAWLGWLGAALSLCTVFCTAMIYAQLKTVPRWHTPLTPALLLSLCLAGGALLAGQISLAWPLLIAAAVLQLLAWHHGDRAFARSGTTLGTATGLGARGQLRAFEPPHTGTNYLLREMAFEVGRKHATKLRGIALTLGYAMPVLLILLPGAHVTAALAVLSHIAGILASRWLFFAQAEHVVGLYYGRHTPRT